MTDPSLSSLPPQNAQPVSQGSTKNFHNTPNNIRKYNQTSDQLPSLTNKSALTPTEENIPAYFNNFMKAINDQINQIRQEFSPPPSSTHTNTAHHLPSQVQFHHLAGKDTLERHNMDNLQSAKFTSNHILESGHPQDTQNTKTIIQDLINTIKRTDIKKNNCPITNSKESASQQYEKHNPNNTYY